MCSFCRVQKTTDTIGKKIDPKVENSLKEVIRKQLHDIQTLKGKVKEAEAEVVRFKPLSCRPTYSMYSNSEKRYNTLSCLFVQYLY